jgi:hypothetical protein
MSISLGTSAPHLLEARWSLQVSLPDKKSVYKLSLVDSVVSIAKQNENNATSSLTVLMLDLLKLRHRILCVSNSTLKFSIAFDRC